ncbi:uncharacterized protein LOC115952495 [Quercus lobata]|uniref:uncharacterized protein LOC115952495 n=1 Tax=Quercus lobata TaxID=97700 RepID=UPI001244A960|nr:uncharacterized protein LOC115952495 [Quercus lobata]
MCLWSEGWQIFEVLDHQPWDSSLSRPDRGREVSQVAEQFERIQVLTGMLAALNRFISKFSDRCRPFYLLLKKWKGFWWDDECEKAFQDLKEYLTRAPMLTAPEPREELFMYLFVFDHAVSAVLLRDRGVQQPVYYISKTLVDVETRYLPLKKLVLALVHATRKLPQYFQTYTVLGFNASNNEAEYEALLAGLGTISADNRIPDDEKEANKIRRVAAWYWLSKDRKLYRRSFEGPYLLCLHLEKVGQLLAKLHEGAEAEALANIQDVDVKKYVWKNIITRFGVPDSLISDNGLQFDSRAFRKFCSNLGIKNRYSSPVYPQGNGQAEVVNKVIVNDLKRRLEGAKGN